MGKKHWIHSVQGLCRIEIIKKWSPNFVFTKFKIHVICYVESKIAILINM